MSHNSISNYNTFIALYVVSIFPFVIVRQVRCGIIQHS